jgi:hypothetical protein
MRNSFVASATNATLTGRAIDGARSAAKSSGTAARLQSDGHECVSVPSWPAIQKADLLSRWAFNPMLIGMATRKYARSVRQPDGDLAGQARRATRKSSVSRRFCGTEHGKAEGMAGG